MHAPVAANTRQLQSVLQKVGIQLQPTNTPPLLRHCPPFKQGLG